MSVSKKIGLGIFVMFALMMVTAIIGLVSIYSELHNRMFVGIMLIAVVVINIIVTLIMLMKLKLTITKPLNILVEWFGMTAHKGDIIFKPDELEELNVYGRQTDEIGKLFNGYAELIKFMNVVNDELGMVSDGKLDFEVEPRSGNDLLSITLKKMMENLNSIVKEMGAASEQVDRGSTVVSNGSQALARTTAEGDRVVTGIVGNITKLEEMIESDRDQTDRAADLAESIMKSAEIGSKQMDEMTTAVQDIEQASKSISKVIKAIDDIAFQTNILALNAGQWKQQEPGCTAKALRSLRMK